MDSESDQNNVNKVSVKPSTEFVAHFIAEASMRIGQCYLEERESHPEILSKVNFLHQFKIKLRDPLKGELVLKNVKGLLALASQTFNLPEVVFETKLDGDNVIISISVENEEKLQYVIEYLGLKYDVLRLTDLWKRLELNIGKADGKLQLGIGPAYFFMTDFESFKNSIFDIWLSLSGDMISLIRMFYEELKREAEGKNDVIQSKLADPLNEYIEKNILNPHSNGEFVKIDYEYEHQFVQGVIDEYNADWGNENVKMEFNNFQNQMLNEEVLKSVLQGFFGPYFKLQGFFGPYFKLLEYIDFEDIEGSLWNNAHAMGLKVRLNIVGANQLIDQKVLCHLKK